MSDSLHALVSRLNPGRFRNFLHRGVCFFTGHPVDVSSGKVMTEFVDIELPGPLPLKVERIYSSAFAARPGPLGHGWSFSLDQAIWRERGKVVLLAEDGREIEFDTFDFPRHRIEAGERVYNPIERLTLCCDSNDAWRVIDHGGVIRQFSPVPKRVDGRAMIRSTRSRCGEHEIGFHYGTEGHAAGQLEWVRDSGGRLLRLVHDADGRLRQLHLPKPRGEGFYQHRHYEYDDAGDLVNVGDSLGHTWSFAYLGHLLTQETDRNGLSFYFVYDGIGSDSWCIRTWGDGGIYDHVLCYDKQNHATFVTDSLGHTTQYHMNVVGQVVKIVDALNGETHYEYDPVTLRRTKVVDALGQATVSHYDARGHLIEQQAPGRGTWASTVDEYGLPVEALDGVGGRWQWTYDRHGRMIERVDSEGALHRCSYERGLLQRVSGPGCDITFAYDSQLNRTQTSSPQGTLDLEYDALGQVIAATSRESGFKCTFVRNLEGKIVTNSTSDGVTKHLRHDAEGAPIEIREHDRRTVFEYTGLQRLARQATEGISVAMVYDTEGRLTSVSKGHGEHHEFELDPVGEVACERSFDGRVTRYERNRARQVTTVIRPSGRRTKFEHDGAGRITRLQHGDGTFQSYEYRHDDILVRADNELMSVTIERDLRGRVLREQVGDSWVSTAYSMAGAQTQRRTSNGLTEDFSHDPQSRVTSILAEIKAGEDDHASSELRWAATMHLDSEGHVRRQSHEGGLVLEWERDGLGRPRRWVAHLSDRTNALERRYAWAPNGALDKVDDISWRGGHASLDLERRYAYDAAARLTATRRSDGSVEVRAFDGAGNVHRGEGTSNRVYAGGGRLVVDGDTFNTYDDDGRLIERAEGDQRTQFRWDDGGLLREVLLPTGERLEFCYDAMGRRHHKRVFDTGSDEAKAAYRWQWSGHVPIHEQSDDGLMTWVYEPHGSAPVAQLSGGRAWTLATDQVGAPTEMFSASGELVWRRETDMDGKVSQIGADVDCPLRWPGQYFDRETGLHCNRWRYYDPHTAGYLSPDPMGLFGGLRPYGYPLDPLTHADPFGLIDPWDIHFSQNSISSMFSPEHIRPGPWAGRPIEEAIAAARALGRLPDGLELHVIRINRADWVTLSNRTLYVAQEANLSQVHPVMMPGGGNQLHKLTEGGSYLPLGEQPEVRAPCGKSKG